MPRLLARLTGWSGRRRALTAAVMTIPVVLIIAGMGSGVPGGRVDLTAGTAWLSSSVGQVALVSGSSGRPVAVVAVAPSGDDLDVVQAGTDAYVVDHNSGTVSRVDGSTFDSTAPVTFAPDGGSDLQVLVGGGQVFVLDGSRGLVYQVDPKSLATTGSPRPLDAQVSPGSAVVDDTGRLWVLDRRTGDLSWYDDSTTGRRAVGGQQDSLTTAAGQPVLIDPNTAQWLDQNGNTDATVNLDLRDGEQAQVSGTPDGKLLAVVADRGLLKVCDHDNCAGAAYPLTNAGPQLGHAVAYQGRDFVPDYTNGTVHIIDARTGSEVATPVILNPTAQFDLFEWDTVLFYNDSHSHRAGVVRLDGTFTTVQKYAPDNPGGGVDVAANNQQAPAIVPPTIPPQTPSSSTTPLDQLAAASSRETQGITINPKSVTGGGTGTSVIPTSPTSTTSPSSTTSAGPAQCTAPTVSPPVLQGQAVVGQPASLTAQATGTVDSWAWSVTPSGEKGSGAGSFSFTPTGAEPGSGYTVTVTVTGCGAPPVVQSINVDPLPQCTAPTVSPPVLQGQAVAGQPASLTAQASGTVDSWAWSVTPSGEKGNSAGSFSFTPTANQHYTVTVAVTGCGAPPDAQSINIPALPECTAPTVSQPAFQAPAVVGQLVTLTAQASGTVDSWAWSVRPSGETGSGAGSFEFTPTAVKQYTVTVTVSGCGAPPNAQSGTIVPIPQCTAPRLSPPAFGTPVVVGQPENLSALATGTVDSWAWSVSPSGETGSSAGSFSFTPTAAKQYTVTVTVTGCGAPPLAQSVSFSAESPPPPPPICMDPPPICKPGGGGSGP